MVSVFGVAYFGKSGLPVTQESAKRAEVPHGQTRGKMVGRWEVIICGQMGECGRLSVNVLARWCYKARWPTSCKGQGEERAAGGAVEQPRITKLIFFWTTLVQSPSCKYKVLNPSASYPGIEMLIGMSQRFTRQIVRGRCVAGFSKTTADQTTHSSPDRLILTKWQMQ